MQVHITGKNLDIGSALRQHIEEKVSSHVDKYFERAISASITVEKQKSTFSSECVLHLATGLKLHSKGEGGDAYSSFDLCLEHMGKRLRRYKRRLNNHHRQRQEPIIAAEAASFVIASAPESENEESEELNPAIIAESTREILSLSVGEAVMKLEISNMPFVLFKNDKHDQINIVYRRDDGNIGWVDPGYDAK
jgi:ribosomal subunit interface protein